MTKRDDHLLSRAAQWPEHSTLADLTPNVLREIATQYDLDFATAVLYDRVTRSVEHGPTIERIQRARPSTEMATHEAGVIGIMPGAFYIESPHTGADGHGLAPEALRRGWRCELIGAKNFGSLAENAAVLQRWLADHRDERVVLVSLSKGGAEVKWALREPQAAKTFQNVAAWINVSGILNGSPLVRWLLDRPWRTLLVRMLFWYRGHQFSVLHELAYGSDTPLDFPVQLPEHLLAVHVIGFPLAENLSSKLARRGYRRLAPWGPNDAAGIVLADVCHWPGLIYPIWQADHYLRTPGCEPSSIIGSLLDWLGNELRESNGERHLCRSQSVQSTEGRNAVPTVTQGGV